MLKARILKKEQKREQRMQRRLLLLLKCEKQNPFCFPPKIGGMALR